MSHAIIVKMTKWLNMSGFAGNILKCENIPVSHNSNYDFSE